MTFTVADIFAQELAMSTQVIAGETQLSSRHVRWVSLLDPALGTATYPDEIVIATDTIRDRAQIAASIRAVAGAGAAALVLNVTPENAPFTRLTAEAAALPVIVLPANISPQIFSHRLLAWLMHHSASPTAIHQQWLQYLLDGATLTEILQALAIHWQRPVLLLDHVGYPIAHAGIQGQHLVASLAYWHARHRDERLPALLPDDHLFTMPLNTPQAYAGTLITPYRGSLPTYQEWEMVREALLAVGMALQQHSGRHPHARREDDLIWELATGDAVDEADIYKWGQIFGFDVRAPTRAIVGQIAPDTAIDAHRLIDSLHEEKMLPMPFIGSVGHQHIIFFVNESEAGSPVAEQLCHMVSHMMATTTVSWGVSELRSGIGTFAKSYQDASFACQIGMQLHGSGKITFAAQTASYRLLHKVSQDPASRQFWEQHLGGLAQASRKSADLLETLEVYLATQGNASETARQMGLHRQTLNYRLQRIEDITRCHLDDPQARFALELSVRLYRLHALHVRPRRDVAALHDSITLSH